MADLCSLSSSLILTMRLPKVEFSVVGCLTYIQERLMAKPGADDLTGTLLRLAIGSVVVTTEFANRKLLDSLLLRTITSLSDESLVFLCYASK